MNTQTLTEYSHEAMLRYSTTVLEDRALPDMYDGLKPVQRRVLYAMYTMGLTSKHEPVKAARVVGNCMGLYHPHGDSSIFSGLTTLVNQPTNPVRGVGNWGSMTADAGAARYVNCHLSSYADNAIFNVAYTPVMDLVPNYDEKDVEPVLLPCLLPNLLLNGATGIAVAATCNIPPFKVAGVIKLLEAVLAGKTLTPKMCAQTLHLNYTYGGVEYTGDKEAYAEWEQYFKTGIGSIYVGPEYRWNEKTRILQVYGFPPGTNLVKSLEHLNNEVDCVVTAYESTDVSSTDKCTVDIKLKPFKPADKDAVFEDALSTFWKMVHFKTNVTVRTFDGTSPQTTFKATNVIEILTDWCARRIELEQRALSYQITQLQVKIDKANLMLLAVKNKSIVLACLDAADPDKALAKGLKITLEQAKQILDMQIRKLSKMDGTQLVGTLSNLNATLKSTKASLRKPADSVLANLKLIAQGI